MSRLEFGNQNQNVRDVGGLGICIMGGSVLCFLPEIASYEPQYSVRHFAAFLSLILRLKLFGDDDSQIP